MARHVILILCALLVAVPILGQENGAVSQPEVILSIPDNASVTSWRNLRLQYTIVNGTYKSGIGVNSLTISVPSNLAVTSSTLSRASDGSLKAIASGFQMRDPGERRDCPPIELRAKYWAEVRSQLFSLLTYRGQKETIVATLEYQFLDRPDAVSTKTTRLEINIVPNPAGVYAGALVGALLIALLIPANRLATQLGRSGKAQFHVRAELETFAARFGRGMFASAIAVLLLQTTSDFNFPISVGVQDFYGGVLIGLLGDKVAEQILNYTRRASGQGGTPPEGAQTTAAPAKTDKASKAAAAGT